MNGVRGARAVVASSTFGSLSTPSMRRTWPTPRRDASARRGTRWRRGAWSGSGSRWARCAARAAAASGSDSRPRPSISSSPGTRSGRGVSASGRSSRPSGLGSSSTLWISLPDTPSTTEWWILVSSATRPLGQPLDHVQLPQRAAAVQRAGEDPRHRLGQLPVVAGRRHGGLADVEVEVEVGVLDPVRVVEPERDGHEPPAQRRQQREALRDQAADVLDAERAARRGRRVVDREPADMAVRALRTRPPGTGRRGWSAAASGLLLHRCRIHGCPFPRLGRCAEVSARAEVSDSTKRLVLVACILGTTVVTVDSSAINVALPAIAEDLGGGLAGQQWVANAYLVTLGSLLLVGGSLGDILGERRVFIVGVGGFGSVSLLCALAPTIELLVAGRALQGVMGALLSPAALAVIVATFPPSERGKAVGAWTAWGGIGTVLGPVDRRAAGGRRVVALDLRHQRADRRDHADGDRAGDAGRARARPGRAHRLLGRGAVRARPGGDHVRADRAAAARLGRPAGGGGADRRRAAVRRASCWLRAAHAGADAAARPVLPPQLRRREHRDVRDVRRARRRVLPARAVPAAGGGLLGAGGRHRERAGDDRDVPAGRALRPARRPRRAAAADGLRPAARRGRDLPAAAPRRRRRLPDGPAARRCWCSRSGCR